MGRLYEASQETSWAYLAAIVDSSEDAIIGKTLEGVITSWNRGAEQIYGYSAQEMIGKSISLLVPSNRLNDISGILVRIGNGEQIKHYESQRVRKNGTLIDVSLAVSPIHDPSGRIIGASSIARDITERKQTQVLRNTVAQLEAQKKAIDQFAIVAETDAHGRITYANDKFCEISKYSREELIGKDHRDVVNSGYHPRSFWEDFWNTIRQGKVWRGEVKNRAKDGSIYWVDTAVVPFLGADGKPEKYLAIRAVVTERKQAEEELRAALRQLEGQQKALDQFAIVAETDATGRITYANDQFCEISKYSREELLGKDHREVVNSGYHPKEFWKQMWATISRGQLWRGDVRNRAKDGTIYWVDTAIVPFMGPQGRPEKYLAMRAVITERKQLEEQLKETNQTLEQRIAERTSTLSNANEELKSRTAQLETASKEMDAFSYSVSHDLRTPLRGIDGFSQALLEDYADTLDAKGKDYLQRVRAGSQHMGKLIDDLLKLSRLTRGELRYEEVNISALASAFVAEFQKNQPERQVECVIAPGLVAHGDPGLLRVVLENLLGNAWKFTGKQPRARIEVGVIEHDGKPAYFVRDNGAGFNMAYVGKLFGAFQRLHATTEFEGTGVGLVTVQRIIHRHGGRVWAEGAVGQGATFYFTL